MPRRPQALIEQCDIPVFHDDQHGTFIVTVGSRLNVLKVQGKRLENAKIVCLGAQSAGLYMIDRTGAIHSGRAEMNSHKRQFINDSTAFTCWK